MALQRIRIVLVETSHPGNIGGAARAMKNMGLADLALVRPGRFPDAEATARASGADDVLAAAQVYEDLDAALAGCRLVVGTSARSRNIPWPLLTPRACAERAWSEAQAGEVALVFGREHSGLTNAELERCHYLVHIDTHPEFSSLNLAAAVQVLSYELRLAMLASEGSAAPAEEVASSEAMGRFFEHLEQTLLEIGFFKAGKHDKSMRRLKRLFQRARPDGDELDMLHGILSAARGRKYQWMKKNNLGGE